MEKWKWSQVGILHLREGEAAACQPALHDMQLLHQKRPEKNDWNINKLQKLEDALRETAETGETGDTSETWADMADWADWDRNQTFNPIIPGLFLNSIYPGIKEWKGDLLISYTLFVDI